MNFIAKIKETVSSVVPIAAIVVALHLTISPLPAAMLAEFLIGACLLVAGLSIFLLGADLGLIPVGQKIGSQITQKRNAALVLLTGFAVGFVITVAEPDVQVLAVQILSIAPDVNSRLLVLMIAVGVGFFVLVALARMIWQVPLRRILVVAYLAVFAMAAFAPAMFVGIAFDSGGATTGPMTVPFLLALGMGVSAVRKSSESTADDSFGLVGVASIGPIMAVIMMSLFVKTANAVPQETVAAMEKTSVMSAFSQVFPQIVREVLGALWPLVAMMAFFQAVLLRLPFTMLRRAVTGLIYTFVGLVLFLLGVQVGFMPAGRLIGSNIANFADGLLLVPLGLVFGATVVCAEPAVWVLTQQIEDVMAGRIKRRAILLTLSVGVAIAVALAMLRVKYGFSIWRLLVPLYALALGLTFVCPPFFTAIAFDSGGVASGPMSSTFILSFALGAAGGDSGETAFGVIAMIATIPLVAIQILGVIFKFARNRAEKAKTMN